MGQRMMKIQLEYALNQLHDAFSDKLPDRPEPYLDEKPKDEAFIKLIESGKVNLGEVFIEAVKKYRRHPSRTPYCYNVLSVFQDELRRELEDKKPEPKLNPEFKKWEKKRDKLNKLFKQAKDELMLGDAEHALKLIEKFRNVKV